MNTHMFSISPFSIVVFVITAVFLIALVAGFVWFLRWFWINSGNQSDAPKNCHEFTVNHVVSAEWDLPIGGKVYYPKSQKIFWKAERKL
jgi:hypothetical protein